MEAALCGALVVCSDHPLNGMVLDYASEETAMIYKQKNIDHAAILIRNPIWQKKVAMQNFIRNNNAN